LIIPRGKFKFEICNSRTAEEPDFIDFEINEHEEDFTEFLQNDLATLNELNIDKNRKNVDKVKSRSGNNLLDICKANNLFIVNGRIGDDKTESGKLTCKNSSVVDYCICTCSFLQFVYNFKVLDFVVCILMFRCVTTKHGY
jgi:hypothetical protein